MNNPARPAPGTVLARVSEIADPGAIARDFREGIAIWSVLITRTGDQIAAFENRCAHAGFPLERFDGRVVVLEGKYLMCAAHGACFALMTGAVLSGPGPAGRGLTPVPVRVEGEEVVLS